MQINPALYLSFASYLGSDPTSSNRNGLCCDLLIEKLPGKVHLPEQDTYDVRIESLFSATASLKPWCIVLPETTSDVSQTMALVSYLGCPFGIRSGGHAFYANGNSVANGITIDTGYLNSTTYDAETNIAIVEPGARWGSVYETLAKDGVAVVGGRLTSVGVGGLILGGGLSYHSSRYGFACDAIRAYEIVLANGTVALATADSHPDLFRSLRGGSGNFGIVTKFHMQAVNLKGGKERPHIWGGLSFWPYDNMDLVNELVRFEERAAEDDGCSAYCAWMWINAKGDKAWSSACGLQNLDDREDAPLLEGLKNIPGSLGNSFRSAPVSSFTDEMARLSQDQKHNVWSSSTFKADPQVLRFAIEQHKILSTELSSAVPDDPDAFAIMIFQPLTKPLISHGAHQNMLGLEEDAESGPGTLSLLIVQAGSEKNADIARPLVKKFEESIDGYAKSVGSFWRWTYLNYVDFSKDPIANYGPKNVEFLQQVAKDYDPQQIFQNVRMSGHKLPRV